MRKISTSMMIQVILLSSASGAMASCIGVDYGSANYMEDVNRILVSAKVADDWAFDRYQQSFVDSVCTNDLGSVKSHVESQVVSLQHAILISNQLGRSDISSWLTANYGAAQKTTGTAADHIGERLGSKQITYAKSAFYSLSPTERQILQGTLKDLNYYWGAIDGIWGNGTQRAIENYYVEQYGLHQLPPPNDITQAIALLRAIMTHYDRLEGMEESTMGLN